MGLRIETNSNGDGTAEFSATGVGNPWREVYETLGKSRILLAAMLEFAAEVCRVRREEEYVPNTALVACSVAQLVGDLFQRLEFVSGDTRDKLFAAIQAVYDESDVVYKAEIEKN